MVSLLLSVDKKLCLKCLVLLSVGYLLSMEGVAQTKWVKTTGKLPQLAWSTGQDRLGSAKMGYIDTGIVLLVTDSLAGRYKVQLSENRHAFLDTTYAQPFVTEKQQPPVTIESWSVKGTTANTDLVAISVGRKVAYQSWMETQPARIVVELYGVQANTNWITQLQSAKEVALVDYRQTEDDVVQVTITLKHKQHMGYSLGYVGNSLQLQIKRLPTTKQLKDRIIVIDAGHGGSNIGAKGVTSGKLEKEFTLLFAKVLQKELNKKGVQVKMIREKDTTIDNKDRVIFAIAQNADLYVSFHLNSSGRSSVKGISTYYKHAAFSSFSSAILQKVLQIKGLSEFGHVGSFNFQPVQPTNYPSCLVEVAFLSNPEDEEKIGNPSFRKAIGRQVRKGLQIWWRHLQ